MSHAARMKSADTGVLPLFHQPSEHDKLDALGRTFNRKRWPDGVDADASFHKALLIRQMRECLERAPHAVRASNQFAAAEAAWLEYSIYSSGTHPSTHIGHKNWSGVLRQHFLALAKESAVLCNPERVADAVAIDSSKVQDGHYPLWDEVKNLPRQIELAGTIMDLKKASEKLHDISLIEPYHTRREAYGRWLHHIEPFAPFIDKYAERPESHEVSLRARLEGNAQPAKKLGMLSDALALSSATARATEKHFSLQPHHEHCLVVAYRHDRKGCKELGIPAFHFTSRDARDSAVMDVVYAARWGAVADRLAGELIADGVNLNRSSIATKHAMPKVDALMEFCGLPKPEQQIQRT